MGHLHLFFHCLIMIDFLNNGWMAMEMDFSVESGACGHYVVYCFNRETLCFAIRPERFAEGTLE